MCECINLLCAHSLPVFILQADALLFPVSLQLSVLQLYSISSSYIMCMHWLTSLCNQESGNCGSGCELQGLTGAFSGWSFTFFSEKNPELPQTAAWASSHLTGKRTCLIDAILLSLMNVVCIYMSLVMCLCSSGQKKCVIEELYQFEFFSELLKDLGAEIALAMP